jgi:beta-glucanase (GH16 family)
MVRALFACLMLSALSASAQELSGWELVWSDEFDGPDIDMTKWSHEVNGWGGGNDELQYYTARTNNSFIENGNLVIQALEESYSGWEYPPGGGNGDWINADYTSARLRTLNKGDWTYGRFEARMKLPYGQGLWPAFWMLPTDWVYGGWAASGEIDIMEIIGSEPDKLHGTIHYGDPWPNNTYSGGSYTLPSGDFSDDFHVFAIEWEEGEIRWYIDGFHYHTETSWYSSGGDYPAPFNQRFHLLLNVAVGGNWPGSPNGSTVFPQRMEVDYVRVYTPSNTPPEPPAPGANVLVNPGFETGSLGPWVGYSLGGANAEGTYVQSTSDTYYNGGNPGGDNVLTHSGTYVGKIYGDFDGTENYNGCYQDVAAEPGSIWNADGWALTHAQDLFSGNLETWIEVSFRDVSDTVLALYRSDVLTPGNVAVSSWMYLAVTNQLNPSTFAVTNTTSTLTAPAGTATARYQLIFRQPAPFYDNGAMYYDDLNLFLQPSVLPFGLRASVAGGDFQIHFPTQNSIDYQVMYKDSVTNDTWIPIETVTGDGNTNTVTYPATNPARFYQVVSP